MILSIWIAGSDTAFMSSACNAEIMTGKHIGKLVHLVVFLLFVPGIFGSLGMDEISMPILNLLDTMWPRA